MATSYADAHSSPQGPGDARPTALQIILDNNLVGKLTDQTILVTGGTDGLGLEPVRQLAKTGAHVFFTARNATKAEKIIHDILEEAKVDEMLKGTKVEWVEVDNASLESVKKGAEDFLRRSDQLNVLVCNAGISQTPHAVTKDGYEKQFAVNHLAHFLLFNLLRPLLLRSSTPSLNSRVVCVSSVAHGFSTVQLGNYNLDKPPQEQYDPMCELEGDYNPMILYGQSKTANIWFANEIDRRYGGKGLHGLSIHPGTIVTAGWKIFKSVEQGAATQVLAAVGKDYEGKDGMYLDDCGVGQPIPDDVQIGISGYRPWAYNPDGERRLWKDSLDMVGVKDDQETCQA
ncbi:hypothetical protein LTR08_001126 [Meristemomyces frigidus]|nr:hypothetical protein LTR08_001126 [Meristemomyces frigidus]